MERFISHKNLKLVEILMSYQPNKQDNNPSGVIALAKGQLRPHVSNRWDNLGEIEYKTSYNNQGELKQQSYILWCNDGNLSESGFQHLTTPTGRSVSFRVALRRFNDAKKATRFVNFSKI
jgi:hypothetical protein